MAETYKVYYCDDTKELAFTCHVTSRLSPWHFSKVHGRHLSKGGKTLVELQRQQPKDHKILAADSWYCHRQPGPLSSLRSLLPETSGDQATLAEPCSGMHQASAAPGLERQHASECKSWRCSPLSTTWHLGSTGVHSGRVSPGFTW
eukprot:2551763-Amphidinium_carterae.2